MNGGGFSACSQPQVSLALQTIRPESKKLILKYILENKEKVLLDEKERETQKLQKGFRLDKNEGLRSMLGKAMFHVKSIAVELANAKMSGELERHPKEEGIVRDFLRQNTGLFKSLGVREGEISDDDMKFYSQIVYKFRRIDDLQNALTDLKSIDEKSIKGGAAFLLGNTNEPYDKTLIEQKEKIKKTLIDVISAFVDSVIKEECDKYSYAGGRRRRKTKRTYRKRTVRKNKHR
jgi:hypothetical protein